LTYNFYIAKYDVYVKLKVYQYFSWKVYQNRLFSS
jgi:hypothetical protein